MRKRGGYSEAFSTRFGQGLALPEKKEGARRIWIQAVSLGEMLAIEPMLRALAADERNEIFLTATTSTGYAIAKEKYSDFVVGLAYFPLDFWLFSRRVWNVAKPDLAICAETEMWPEHMRQARKRGVPMLLVNARLSDRSFKYSLKLKSFISGELDNLSFVLAGSLQDSERFEALGFDQSRIEVTGNMKVDVSIDPLLSGDDRRELKRSLKLGDGFLILGSSTWPGEEEMMLEAYRRVREMLPEAKMIIVPRHGERRDEIRGVMEEQASGLRWHFKSEGMPTEDIDVLIGDTHGELRGFTQISDLAFIGKSLPPHKEGQTPIECGLLGVPMVFGSGMSNFKSIHSRLVESGAACKVREHGEAIQAIVDLAQDAGKREAMVRGSRNWALASKGALQRTLTKIQEFLDQVN
ncbi:MAG: glycosyltransferase N-terminal domain-containing protein [Verrucomicrobiota bacterium]